jgi:hypothetical protein
MNAIIEVTGSARPWKQALELAACPAGRIALLGCTRVFSDKPIDFYQMVQQVQVSRSCGALNSRPPLGRFLSRLLDAPGRLPSSCWT